MTICISQDNNSYYFVVSYTIDEAVCISRIPSYVPHNLQAQHPFNFRDQ